MNDLAFKILTRDSSSFAKLEEIFDEAFPPEEIAIPFRDYVALSEQQERVRALEIADGEKPIGLFLYVDADGHAPHRFWDGLGRIGHDRRNVGIRGRFHHGHRDPDTTATDKLLQLLEMFYMRSIHVKIVRKVRPTNDHYTRFEMRVLMSAGKA